MAKKFDMDKKIFFPKNAVGSVEKPRIENEVVKMRRFIPPAVTGANNIAPSTSSEYLSIYISTIAPPIECPIIKGLKY